MRFAWGAIGLGFVIYAVMYLVWSGLVIYGLSSGILSLLVRLIVLASITTIAARSLKIQEMRELAPYTISWAACAVILDGIFLLPFAGFSMYATWSVWLGYALVAGIPLLTTSNKRSFSRVGLI